jgi:hypothetical protein
LSENGRQSNHTVFAVVSRHAVALRTNLSEAITAVKFYSPVQRFLYKKGLNRTFFGLICRKRRKNITLASENPVSSPITLNF